MGREDGEGNPVQVGGRFHMKNDQRCTICGFFIRPGEEYCVIILPGAKAPEYVHKDCEGKKERI